MGWPAVIAHTAQFKKPVQGFALFYFDKPLMHSGDNGVMFTEFQTLTQENGGGRIKRCITGSGHSKVVIAAGCQLPGGLYGPLGPIYLRSENLW